MSVYCGNCGMENEDNSRFCAGCGMKLNSNVSAATKTEKTTKARKKSFKKWFVLPVAGAAALVVFLGMSSAKQKTVDLSEYVTVEFAGANGYGTATAVLDEKGLSRAVWSAMGHTEADRGNYRDEKIRRDSLNLDEIVKDVTVTIEENEMLHNGENITVTIAYSGFGAGDSGVVLKEGSFEETIVGLEEAKPFKPFDYVTVEYTGAEPYASVKIETGYMPEFANVVFKADKDGNLSNGDTVTVTASLNTDEADFANTYHKYLAQTEETYTVEGISRYVTSLSEISEEMLDKLYKAADQELRERNKNSPYYVSESECLGAYFLSTKKNTEQAKNYVIVVEKLIEREPYFGSGFEFYSYAIFQDIKILPDGTLTVDFTNIVTPDKREETYSAGMYGMYRFGGYANVDGIFSKRVAELADRYQYESNIREESEYAEAAEESEPVPTVQDQNTTDSEDEAGNETA